MTAARLAAARALLAIDRGKTTLAAEVDEARQTLTDPRDRGLLLELTAGVLRWRNELDRAITATSRRPIGSIDVRALVALRLGAYQLRHLHSIPPHALVNESVELARALGARKATGFVNAVLRALARRGASWPLPARPLAEATRDARLTYLEITCSHPRWLVARWLDRYGFEATERWCGFNNAPPTVTVRPVMAGAADALLQDLHAAGLEATVAGHVPDALQLGPGVLGQVPAELRRRMRVQDEGAQLVARQVRASRGESVLDLCASPGGKALVLAADMELSVGHGRLVTSDYRAGRVALLARAVRSDAPATQVVRLDARLPLPFGAVFDAVLVDVPCSGLGTLRRDPDLKWTRREEELQTLAASALGMLTHASEVVRAGGRLVYATCSSEPEENQEVVASFLERHPAFVPEGPALATTPFADDLDAFFAATLVRKPSA